jgi:hypothetical protein
MGQFIDGQAEHESGNKYAYFSAGPDGVVGTSDDLVGRLSMRRYRYDEWSNNLWGEVRDWKVPQNQDMVAMHYLWTMFSRFRLQFPSESLQQLYQRLACLWKAPSMANDPNPKSSWSSGTKSYIRYAGEAINGLGYEGWTTGQGWLA